MKSEENRTGGLVDTVSEFLTSILIGIVVAAITYFAITFLFKWMHDGALYADDKEVAFFFAAAFFFAPYGWNIITYVFDTLLPFRFLGSLDVVLIIHLLLLVVKAFFSILIGVPCFVFLLIRFVIKLLVGIIRH